MVMTTGERQYGALDEIREDHKARYDFVVNNVQKELTFLDAACGCGYGSYILSKDAVKVYGIDNSFEAIQYANARYRRKNVFFWRRELPCGLPDVDISVCFETIEHILNPLQLLKDMYQHSHRLFASVPNQDRLPFREERFPFHHRHYTKQEFEDLLNKAGWKVVKWYGQEDAWSDVKENVNGRTLVVECEKCDSN